MHPIPEHRRILGLAGSLRAGSFNRMLLRAAHEVAPGDVDVSAWHRLKAVPPFDEDDERAPGQIVEDLRGAIADADAVLLVTPEYNGSIPGQLKNALDWASRPRPDAVLINKPVAVIGASPSPGGARHAQADARRILGRTGAHVLDLELAIARSHEQFDADAQLIDPQLRVRLGTLVAALADACPRHAKRPDGSQEPALL